MITLVKLRNPGEEKIPPGTLFSITPQQSSAIELGIVLGEKLQGLFPEIADDYRRGNSASQIVKKHNLEKILGCNYKVALSSVFHAISGYDGLFHILDIKPYEGLIKDQDEVKELAKKHNSESCRLVGKDMLENKKGIFSMTKKERYKASCQGAVGRGMKPYSKEEFAFIKKLAKDSSYLKGKLLNVKKIANEVNEKFHNGVAVRLSKSITKLLFRKKIRKAIQFVYSEEELNFIKELVNNPKYQKGKNSLLKEICKDVNTKIHEGKGIRTPNGINKFITRNNLKNPSI